MKYTCLSLMLFCMSFLTFSQNFNSDYQDGKIIFQVPVGGHMFKTFQGKLQPDDNPFLADDFQEFGIFEVVQLHPDIKDEKLVRTYEIRFSEIEKTDILIGRVKSEIEVVYAEKKELHKM